MGRVPLATELQRDSLVVPVSTFVILFLVLTYVTYSEFISTYGVRDGRNLFVILLESYSVVLTPFLSQCFIIYLRCHPNCILIPPMFCVYRCFLFLCSVYLFVHELALWCFNY